MAHVLTEQHLRFLHSQGEQAYPQECCGFVIGHASNAQRHVVHLQPTINERRGDEGRTRYLISPENYRHADTSARGLGLDILGFYHSHPNADPEPSPYDAAHAWPWFSYLILSVHDGEPGALTSWILREDRSVFDPENVTLDNPDPLTIA